MQHHEGLLDEIGDADCPTADAHHDARNFDCADNHCFNWVMRDLPASDELNKWEELRNLLYF